MLVGFCVCAQQADSQILTLGKDTGWRGVWEMQVNGLVRQRDDSGNNNRRQISKSRNGQGIWAYVYGPVIVRQKVNLNCLARALWQTCGDCWWLCSTLTDLDGEAQGTLTGDEVTVIDDLVKRINEEGNTRRLVWLWYEETAREREAHRQTEMECVHVCVFVWERERVYTCMCMCICVCVCVCVCDVDLSMSGVSKLLNQWLSIGFPEQQSLLDFFFSFSCVPQLYLWASPLWVRFLCMWPLFNPTIEVVAFHLHGWCLLGVFLLPSFTWHECQDLLNLWNGMHVCTD